MCNLAEILSEENYFKKSFLIDAVLISQSNSFSLQSLIDSDFIIYTLIHTRLIDKICQKLKIRPVVKLELSWVERDQLNPILSLGWGWVDFSQPRLNPESGWVARTRFLLLNIVYYVLKIVYFSPFFSNFFFLQSILQSIW